MKANSPEKWQASAADANIAKLDIPADLHRVRRFEISISMSVRAIENAHEPWHEMRVFADGELQWSRRVSTQHPSPFDGLDYRFLRSVAVGRTLRLQAEVRTHQARRLKLLIEAEEA